MRDVGSVRGRREEVETRICRGVYLGQAVVEIGYEGQVGSRLFDFVAVVVTCSCKADKILWWARVRCYQGTLRMEAAKRHHSRHNPLSQVIWTMHMMARGVGGRGLHLQLGAQRLAPPCILRGDQRFAGLEHPSTAQHHCREQKENCNIPPLKKTS